MLAAICQNAVVADASKLTRERVPAEAFEELDAGKFSGLDAITVGVIAVSEKNGPGFRIDLLKAGVGDGDAMSVISQVAQRLLRSTKGTLGIDMPGSIVEAPESREA